MQTQGHHDHKSNWTAKDPGSFSYKPLTINENFIFEARIPAPPHPLHSSNARYGISIRNSLSANALAFQLYYDDIPDRLIADTSIDPVYNGKRELYRNTPNRHGTRLIWFNQIGRASCRERV